MSCSLDSSALDTEFLQIGVSGKFQEKLALLSHGKGNVRKKKKKTGEAGPFSCVPQQDRLFTHLGENKEAIIIIPITFMIFPQALKDHGCSNFKNNKKQLLYKQKLYFCLFLDG